MTLWQRAPRRKVQTGSVAQCCFVACQSGRWLTLVVGCPQTATTPGAEAAHTCAVCQLVGTLKCGACFAVYYCSNDHLEQHWATHWKECAGTASNNTAVVTTGPVDDGDVQDGVVSHEQDDVGTPITLELAGQELETQPSIAAKYAELTKRDTHRQKCVAYLRVKHYDSMYACADMALQCGLEWHGGECADTVPDSLLVVACDVVTGQYDEGRAHLRLVACLPMPRQGGC